MYIFFKNFLLFFIYSFFGYICECIYCSIKAGKKVTNRGFLIGPYLPIYGVGAMFFIYLLDKYYYDPIVLFIMSCVIATVLEYFTSIIMERVFKARWWDYSNKKLNINGRVCLENTFLFGIGGLIVMYLVNPIVLNVINKLSDFGLVFISLLLFIIFICDLYISAVTIYKLRENSIRIKKDMTNDLSDQLRKVVFKNKFFKKRMLNAFPNIKNINVYNYINDIITSKKKDNKDK